MKLVSMIDHAVLHPTATDEDLVRECAIAAELEVASVCVKPYMVTRACELLSESNVAVGTVVGFPQGGNMTEIKAAEAHLACEQGAVELDMVINIGKALEQDWDYIATDIQGVLDIALQHKAVLKVIFETDFITSDAAKQKLCEICSQLGVGFVKTSTGFGYTKQISGDYNYQGATLKDITLMSQHTANHVAVKASGGIRSTSEAQAMVDAGATRLGTSASQAIATDEPSTQGY
ncbi:MAG: deoxyribose-phosphate aldolase [Planctomycetaceae bacterium]|nr:deoxyribose-phosphate aldolase [Planctomycetaceae bacterium]